MIKQQCKIKADTIFVEWKAMLEQNIQMLLNNHYLNIEKDYKLIQDYLKHLENLVQQVEIEKQKLIIKKSRLSSINSQISQNEIEIERNRLELEKLKLSTKDEKHVDYSSAIETLLKGQNFFRIERLNSYYLVLVNDKLNCILSFDFDGKNITKVNLQFTKGGGEYYRTRDSLFKTCKIDSFLKVDHINQLPDLIQQLSFRLGRIQMILEEFDYLTTKKVLIRHVRDNEESSLISFNFINLSSTFELPFNYQYPFIEWKSSIPKLQEIIVNTQIDYERISKICNLYME